MFQGLKRQCQELDVCLPFGLFEFFSNTIAPIEGYGFILERVDVIFLTTSMANGQKSCNQTFFSHIKLFP
jgi:hypothetical protein